LAQQSLVRTSNTKFYRNQSNIFIHEASHLTSSHVLHVGDTYGSKFLYEGGVASSSVTFTTSLMKRCQNCFNYAVGRQLFYSSINVW